MLTPVLYGPRSASSVSSTVVIQICGVNIGSDYPTRWGGRWTQIAASDRLENEIGLRRGFEVSRSKSKFSRRLQRVESKITRQVITIRRAGGKGRSEYLYPSSSLWTATPLSDCLSLCVSLFFTRHLELLIGDHSSEPEVLDELSKSRQSDGRLGMDRGRTGRDEKEGEGNEKRNDEAINTHTLAVLRTLRQNFQNRVLSS